MSCIVCGSGEGNQYSCSIKDLVACFCEDHFENGKEYDSIEIKQRVLAEALV